MRAAEIVLPRQEHTITLEIYLWVALYRLSNLSNVFRNVCVIIINERKWYVGSFREREGKECDIIVL